MSRSFAINGKGHITEFGGVPAPEAKTEKSEPKKPKAKKPKAKTADSE